ncbi:MAG: phenylalanine--tRNA ligase subunit beta, partial [Actinomycetes bacterium]
KTINWCQVRVRDAAGSDGGEGVADEEPEIRGIVCGAHNFGPGDHVVVALPGTVLPGGFAIASRKTYGHVSDGMICSAKELGLGEDHAGILVLPPDTPVGANARTVLGLGDEVLDIAVTPDRGYCLSLRGLAREAATSFRVGFSDPADDPETLAVLPAGQSTAAQSTAAQSTAAQSTAWPVTVEDEDGCDVFVALRLSGLDPSAPSPAWLQQRVRSGGMRSISLAVDVTNYVMLALGQPLHAYDAAKLKGSIVVRRARPGEHLQTLDGTTRSLDPDDLLIADDSGPIGIAGVMGGASTEIGPDTTDVVLEAAHFQPVSVARSARRHKLSSEASRRFERGVDPQLPRAAAALAARLLVELGGARVEPVITDVRTPSAPVTVQLPLSLPSRVIGRDYSADEVLQALHAVGCAVATPDGGAAGGNDVRVTVTPPSWRPDLTDPYDLVEEVARIYGYDTIPSVLPQAPGGRGLTSGQRLRRRVGRALAAEGWVESLAAPFVGTGDFDALGLPPDDPRRYALRLANPLSDEAPLLRTTLLPGLLQALRRNLGRGNRDVSLFEVGSVVLPGAGERPAMPRPSVDHRPTQDQLAALDAALPSQPLHVGGVAAGEIERGGWWGPGRSASWADAIEAARVVADAAGVVLEVSADEVMPWHPGRCAALQVGERLVGHAGELHPRVCTALGLPARTVAFELDLDWLIAARGDAPVQVPGLSTFPVALQDVALVVDTEVPAGDVESALRQGGGDLLEDLRLFDLYVGEQVPDGKRSLAYALRFRAADRTLTVEEVTAARDAAVAAAAAATGAVLRGA